MTDDELKAQRIVALAGELQPHRVAQVRAELTRGGFGSQSFSEGPHGNEYPIPVSQPVLERNGDGAAVRWGQVGPVDATDREMRRIDRNGSRFLDNAIISLESYLATVQNWYLKPVALLDDERFAHCVNPKCQEPYPRGKGSGKGECGKCRIHRMRHGLAWPLKREAAKNTGV